MEMNYLQKLSYGGKLEYDHSLTFVDLFKRQVDLHPDKKAVQDEKESLTYKELDKITDEMALTLIQRGVKKNMMVGVMLPRRNCFVISAIAIMKAGGAYLPLDEAYPTARLMYMIVDSKSDVLITERDIYESKNSEGGFAVNNLVFFNPLSSGHKLSEKDMEVLSSHKPSVEDYAYMIYTSGSTGTPKGVPVKHKSLSAYIAWIYAIVDQNGSDIVVSHSSFSFSASILELFSSFSVGMTLHILSQSVRMDFNAVVEYIKNNGITVGAFIGQFGIDLVNSYNLPLRLVVNGGVKVANIRNFNTMVLNAYGCTESAVVSIIHKIDAEKDKESIPIGRPVPNIWAYILDENRKPVEMGEVGEICISGLQVSEGYWHRDELTAQKFVPNPFSTCDENKKMYCTGDYGKWNKNCEIEFCGRVDNQVKLRGFRIELEEIEKVLLKYPWISTCCVVLKEVGKAQHICAYYSSEKPVAASNLKKYLSSILTDYMVPSIYMQIDKMPLNPNGKIDKSKLPEPVITRDVEYVAPTNELEKAVCQIFSKVLDIEQIGINDDFFSIGGTSLGAMNVLVGLNNAGYRIKYGDLFKLKTPKEISDFITGSVLVKENYDMDGGYDYTSIKKILSENVHDLWNDFKERPLGNILLTGSTGYLGIHVLRELLKIDTGKIYCLLRPKHNLSTEKRLKTLLMYYFGDTFDQYFGTKIIPVEGDITLPDSVNVLSKFGISTVFNCAAVVKHYEAGDEMDKINVDGVSHLISFCQSNSSRLIQISTFFISGQAGEDEEICSSFSERNLFVGQTTSLKYIWTKFLAERMILENIAYGKLDAKIMRVGNLMGRHSDGEFQINFRSNAFLNLIKAYATIGYCPLNQLVTPVDLSPIDSTAQAVVKLATAPSSMTVFHPYDNYRINLASVIYALNDYGIAIEPVSDDEFMKHLAAIMQEPSKIAAIQGIFHMEGAGGGRNIIPNNDYTTTTLYRLGFKWPLIDDHYLKAFIKTVAQMGFFD